MNILAISKVVQKQEKHTIKKQQRKGTGTDTNSTDSYLEKFEKSGMNATGINPKSNLVEIVEITDHPWFVGVQFHPEYKSTVSNPHHFFIHFL